ncbi:MAG: hypothetical protein P8099_11220 [Gemmatimonadota bacterium]
MPEHKPSNDRGRAIFELAFTSLLIGIAAGAGPLGIIAMQYTSDRVTYWQGAIGASILAVLVVAGFLLYQDWKGPRRIFREASGAASGPVSSGPDAGGPDGPGEETPGPSGTPDAG